MPIIKKWQGDGIIIDKEPEVLAGVIRSVLMISFHKDQIGEIYCDTRELLIELLAEVLVKRGNDMVIDGHAHAAGDFLKGHNIIRILDENNVNRVVLAGTPEINSEKNQDLSMFSSLVERYPQNSVYILNSIIRVVNTLNRSAKNIDWGNEYVHELVKQFPERIIQFYWVNPGEQDIIDKLDKYYEKYEFKGLKLHQGIVRYDLKKENMHEIAQWAAEKEMPIFIHLCTKKEVFDILDLIKQHKNTNFIIAHLIGLEIFIDSGINTSNILFDISCPGIIAQNKVLQAIGKFGAGRITMGSDTPYGTDNLKNAMTRIQELKLSDMEKELILGKNIQQLLKL